jgi:hypothetical protein
MSPDDFELVFDNLQERVDNGCPLDRDESAPMPRVKRLRSVATSLAQHAPGGLCPDAPERPLAQRRDRLEKISVALIGPGNIASGLGYRLGGWACLSAWPAPASASC